MEPIKHVKYSTITAMVVLLHTKSVKSSLGCDFAGVLVDLDHIIEYGSYCSEYHTKWDWNEFFDGSYFDKKGTVKVYFHSWEIAALLCYLGIRKKKRKSVLYGIAVGYLLHLILDEIGNNLNHMGYFEIYRWIKRWKQEYLLQKEGCY